MEMPLANTGLETKTVSKTNWPRKGAGFDARSALHTASEACWKAFPPGDFFISDREYLSAKGHAMLGAVSSRTVPLKSHKMK